MITPSKVIELLKQKKAFGERHPRFVGGIGELLRSDLKPGESIVVKHIQKDGTGADSEIELVLSEEDVAVLHDIGYIFE